MSLCRPLLLAVLGLLIVPAAAPAAPRPLDLGFFEPALEAGTAETQTGLYGLMRSVGGSSSRLLFRWGTVSPTRPDDPTDPADPAYKWGTVDAAVRAATANGQRIILNPTSAPRWAEGPGRGNAAPGSWKPNATAFGRFVEAAATRYSGRYPDPAGGVLARVSDWQAWNEPNLQTHLSPQWTRTEDGYTATSPRLYRGLLNALYRAVKRVDRTNRVITAGTGPYGDPFDGGRRIKPVPFWIDLMCLRARCRDKARFDVASHHPYAIRGPLDHARSEDDVSIPDVERLVRLVNRAVKQRRVAPAKSKPFWITEVSWDSSPPDPDGVPEERRAPWIAQTLHVFWKQRVSLVTWFRVIDQAPVPTFGRTSQSGLFLLDGTPKLGAQAYRFPFVTERASRSRVTLWGKAPAAGPVVIEREAGGAWQPLTTVTAGENRVFTGSLDLDDAATLRARSGSDVSLPWAQRG